MKVCFVSNKQAPANNWSWVYDVSPPRDALRSRLICELCVVCFSWTELDVFGILLYSMLTFMAVVSMLLYIEECVYIYRKVSSNKKSAIIWVNGAAPVSEWGFSRTEVHDGRFFTSSGWVKQRFGWNFKNAVWEMIFFFSPQVIGAMSCLGMWIPSAMMFTDMTSATWVWKWT